MENWDLLDDGSHAAGWNMALDEVLLLTAADRGRPLMRVYGWLQPSVSFGYFQAFPAHLEGEYRVVRRPTGGGVVYHGQDTTYTVVVPRSHDLYARRPAEAYCAVHRAVVAALATQAALHAAPLVSPRGEYECFREPVQGDVVVDGEKLAGGAQRRSRYGMLHQGSISRQVTPDQLTRGFQQELKIKFSSWKLAPELRARADRLATEKYDTDAWNRKR